MMRETTTKLLERKNVKPTAIRQLVLQVLCNNQQAMSLLEIEQQLDHVDRST